VLRKKGIFWAKALACPPIMTEYGAVVLKRQWTCSGAGRLRSRMNILRMEARKATAISGRKEKRREPAEARGAIETRVVRRSCYLATSLRGKTKVKVLISLAM